MRRLVMAAVLTGVLVGLMVPATALGAKPALTCPAADSGYFLVDRQEWWDITVIGFEEEGIQVYEDDGVTFTDEFNEFAAAAGFGDGQGLYDFVWITQWAVIDKNANDLVCMKYRPITPGNPAYFFNGADDQASTKKS